MSRRVWRIHWAWLPAAVFTSVVGWSRYGWWTLLLIAAGLGLGIYGNWKARRRRVRTR